MLDEGALPVARREDVTPLVRMLGRHDGSFVKVRGGDGEDEIQRLISSKRRMARWLSSLARGRLTRMLLTRCDHSL